MIPLLLLGAAALTATVVLVAFWKEIKQFIQRVWEKLPPIIKQQLQGAKVFIQRIARVVKNLFYYYSYNKESQKWTETVVSREVDPNSIPEDIMKKMQQGNTEKVDISDEYEQQMMLTT